MAISTEATVRGVIVGAIRATWAELGFDEKDGNVHEYLLEWENDEQKADYLTAFVGNENIAWAIGVQVVGNDDWFATGNITNRTYSIDIVLYREMGVGGAGINAMIDGARKIRNALRLLGSRLTETVDMVTSTGAIEPRVLGATDARGPILEGKMRYAAQRRNPDF